METVLYKETVTGTRLIAGSEQLTVTLFKNRLELLVQNAGSTDITVVEFTAVERYWLDESRIRIFGSFIKNGTEKVSEITLKYPFSTVEIINILYLFVPVRVRQDEDLAFRRRLQNGILDENVPKGVIHFEFGAGVNIPSDIYVNRCVIRTVSVGAVWRKYKYDLYLPYEKYEIYLDLNDNDACLKSNRLIVTLSQDRPEIRLSAKPGMINLKLKQL